MTALIIPDFFTIQIMKGHFVARESLHFSFDLHCIYPPEKIFWGERLGGFSTWLGSPPPFISRETAMNGRGPTTRSSGDHMVYI